MEATVTSADVLLYLEITVAVLLCIVLYHVLFIVVDLRKVLRRVEMVTNEVENVIMKPLNAADYILESVMKFLDQQNAVAGPKKKSTKKKS